jgi:hypothetical protein
MSVSEAADAYLASKTVVLALVDVDEGGISGHHDV